MAVVFVIYELVDLILLLAAKVVDERVKPMFHALGVNKNWKGMRQRENAIERMCQVEESTMRRTKINGKGASDDSRRVAGAIRDQEGHSH